MVDFAMVMFMQSQSTVQIAFLSSLIITHVHAYIRVLLYIRKLFRGSSWPRAKYGSRALQLHLYVIILDSTFTDTQIIREEVCISSLTFNSVAL